MNALQFLVDHGASVLFWVVFIEQVGLPLPALPLLIAAGALVGAALSVDVRFPISLELDPETIPGALNMLMEEIEHPSKVDRNLLLDYKRGPTLLLIREVQWTYFHMFLPSEN
ncbi:hypothetical protein [Nitrospira sp. KM1]|uniref:hypothetical protein n=1 Tax=Nitrospira sp. KM1 TaxID=1936990 RepID=UPI001566924C|nr:hypothetical protein [Nitrospira sp. KM1]